MRTSIPSAFNTRAVSALAATTLFFASLLPSSALAQRTSYSDVPAGAYYEDAAAALLLSGALDSREPLLRPNDAATRAEVMKLLVNVNGSTLVMPTQSSFSDVPRLAWYYPYMETAAREGWIHGDNNCYGTTPSRCTARPADRVNRAEMAVILKRAFMLNRLSIAPVFRDNGDTGTWYFDPIQTAADHCILQGDGTTGYVRPGSDMNRAEMIVMFYRAQQQQRYGQDCAETTGAIQKISVTTSQKLQVTFNLDLDPNVIGQTQRYSLKSLAGTNVGITNVTVVNSRTVDLSLATELNSDTTYQLAVNNMRTENGNLFGDTQNFISNQGQPASILTVTPQSTSMIRVRFSSDLEASRAQDESRYTVSLVQGTGLNASVSDATLIDSRTVDLSLSGNLTSDMLYRLTVNNMRTRDNVDFSDTETFTAFHTTHHITSTSILTPTRIRLAFDSNLDVSSAIDKSRYELFSLDGMNSIGIQSATLIGNRIVDLDLGIALVAGKSYEVSVQQLRTSAGDSFSDVVTFNYPATTGHVTSVASTSANTLRISFDNDLDALRAEQTVRYTVSDGGTTVPIRTASLLPDQRTVELTLNDTFDTQHTYTVYVSDMLTTQGVYFSGSNSFVYDGGNLSFTASLNGAQETPSVSTTASGTGSFTLTTSGLQYDITVQGLSSAITAAHFHLGVTGQTGNVIVPITFTGNHASGTWSGITAQERDALLHDSVYVNVHTVNHSDGEIRGQVILH